jgi:hypothetical protein
MLYRLLVGTLFLELALRLQVSSTTSIDRRTVAKAYGHFGGREMTKEQIIRWKTMAPPPTR